jgi:hypothetical protein
MVALADQLIEFLGRQTFVQVDDFGLDAVFGQETPGLAAGGSSGFGVELGFGHGQYLGTLASMVALQTSMPPAIEMQLWTPCLRSHDTVFRLRMPWWQ